ncbi:U5 small nuclear ribonucleoprotein TSSC4 [Chanos chanos]|uniref:U5 small nuclear ribonucleoprotein TSSC4 n=1 Tax=Chanos chanos TaxID=29144 RepID=A0A6J2X1A4_CHACN|nr:protein TSSC4 [Chanos chanos]XP_030650156.1 protein TSSC4 [Chanos chanos]XP_030650157.1 protein TSSC4 [Chanos chanos]XP_030650158.1 protein TSSC4 [Chanos chanos]
MSEQKNHGEGASNRLSNRDTIELPDDLSLSDSDPEESIEPIGGRVEDLSSSSDEDEEPQRSTPAIQGKPTFTLRGGSTGFSDRSKNIFEHLESAAKLTSNQLGEDNVLDGTFARPAPPSPPPMAGGKSGGSQNKKQPPAKSVPDYVAHPERWTRYSLEDVPEINDRKNSQLALQYIQDLQARRRSQETTSESFTPSYNQDHGSSSENKILFTKPSQTTKEESTGGQAFSRDKKREVGLFHLEDRQDEEDGERTGLSHLRYTLEARNMTKRKWVEEEMEAAEGDGKPSHVAFHSSRKVNRKNFRRTAEEDEED